MIQKIWKQLEGKISGIVGGKKGKEKKGKGKDDSRDGLKNVDYFLFRLPTTDNKEIRH